MLGITKQTDYALLALTYLASAEDGGAVRARDIAERYGMPVDLLAKILQRLTRSGLLVSSQGRLGGYVLARPVEEITIGAVLEAVEGAQALAQCMRGDHAGCDQHVRCTIRRPLAKINARVFHMLDAIPVSDLTRETADVPLSIGATR
ncbi:MAG: Rrf2 family transcriptional regulator [Armatimonadetes bacterium]|nr:Rrf2 family transcriptional regulator [Armatimonadota bacterium]